MKSGDDGARLDGRDARGRFTKGTTGNPKGRPRKRRRLDVPAQLGRDVINLGREIIMVPGPDGPRATTRHEVVVEAVFRAAVKGRAGSQKLWMDMMRVGLEELLQRHPVLKMADAMRCVDESPEADHPPGLIEAVDFWIKRMRRT